MKTLYSTIFTCIVVTLFGMSFISSENPTNQDHLLVKDECEECHALVDEFDLLAPPPPSECVPFSVYETLKEARDNYDPDDCYSLYSLLYNTISLWAYQANCQGPAFCEDIICKAKCMADCLRIDAVYSNSTTYIIEYLETSCDCQGNDCYGSCGQEECVTCPEDCCGQPDLMMQSIPGGNPGCCKIQVTSPLNPCCNVDIQVLNLDPSDDCITNLSSPLSDAVVIEVCCFDDPDYNPVIEIGAETLCDGKIRLDYIYWEPKDYEICDPSLACCASTIEQTPQPDIQECCTITFRKIFPAGCSANMELILSPALAALDPDIIDLGGIIQLRHCFPDPPSSDVISATAQFFNGCTGEMVTSTWVSPCQ